MLRNKLILVLCLTLAGCGDSPVPKPRGEIRLDYPMKSYREVDSDCPFKFELSDAAHLLDSRNAQYPCWKNIAFPAQRATIHLTYIPINDNLDKLLNDARDMTYEHHVKASNIESEVVLKADSDVYGLIYDVSGNVASTCQFYLTDSTNHFLRGALYFNCRPNWDSLVPANDFIREDINRMVNTLKWSGQKSL